MSYEAEPGPIEGHTHTHTSQAKLNSAECCHRIVCTMVSKEEEIGKAAPRRLPWWKDEYLLQRVGLRMSLGKDPRIRMKTKRGSQKYLGFLKNPDNP